jgi:hypothetical protein
MTDPVNHPPHYTDGTIECIDAIQAQLTPEEYRGYLKGSIAKYVWRERHKGGPESLKKASWYLPKPIISKEATAARADVCIVLTDSEKRQ